MRWTPTGRGERRGPKGDAGLALGESQAKAQNRIEWQRLILCPSRDQEIV